MSRISEHGSTLPLLASREEPIMHAHRFSIGELVAFTERRFPGLVWAAEWEVVDLIEAPDGKPHYRLRGPDGITSEVIPEPDLGPRTVDQRTYPFA